MVTYEDATNGKRSRFRKVDSDGTLKLSKAKTEIVCRRNGQTKTWKTRPGEFRIPVKRGLREFGYIDNTNAHEWEPIT